MLTYLVQDIHCLQIRIGYEVAFLMKLPIWSLNLAKNISTYYYALVDYILCLFDYSNHMQFVKQVAAKVIGEVQALIIFPILPYAILAIFYMFWLSAALHLFSSGQISRNDCNANCCSFDLKANKVNCDNCCGYSIHYTPHIAAAILFHLFGCYWATQFIIASSSTVIAGSVASYYWARGEISVSYSCLFDYP